MRELIAAFVRRSVFANLITVGIITAGMVSLLGIRREAFPNVNFDIVSVSVIYPGASSQEVEKLVTFPIERQLKGVDGIKSSASSSLENRSGIVITIDPDKKDKKQVVQDIKDAVERAKTDLPEDAEEPVITEITSSRTPIIELALSSKPACEGNSTGDCLAPGTKPLSEAQLRQLAKSLQDELELLRDVASVNRRGYRDREIFVEVYPERLAAYNISPDEIANQLQGRNVSFPGGTITEGQREYAVRTVKEFESIAEIENLILRSNDFGGAVRLKDVALVRDDFEKKTVIEKANGREAIILTVLKRESGDAINLVNEVMQVVERFQKNAPEELRITKMNDLSYYIRRRLNVLVGNVGIGLALVVSSLFLFLGWRTSVMVALGIPFSFAFTFILMNALGITINLISLFGLVIVSGMLVDDAIVVGENIYRYLEKGHDPVKSAIKGTAEMVGPVTTAVTTTMAAFAPLLMVGGIMGKFMWNLPAMVILALIASLLESFFILPSHMADIYRGIQVDPREHEKKFETRLYRAIVRLYEPAIAWAYDHRYLVVSATLFAFVLAAGLIPLTGFILFPKSGIEIIFAKVEAPQGVSLDEMERRLRPFEKAVAALPANELQDFTTRIGIIQEQVNDPFTRRGKNYATVSVFLTPENQRKRKASEIINYLAGRLNPDLPVHEFQITGGMVLQVTNQNEATLFQTDGMRPVKTIRLSTEHIVGASLTRRGQELVFYDGGNNLHRMQTSSWQLLQSHPIAMRAYESPLYFSADPTGSIALLATSLGKFYAIDIESGKRSEIPAPAGKITRLQFREDGSHFVLTTDSGSLEIYSLSEGRIRREHVVRQDVPSGRENGRLVFLENKKRNLPYSANLYLSDDKIFVPYFDGSIRIFDLKSNKFTERYLPQDKPLYYVAPAGAYWVLGYRDEVSLYDPAKQQIIRTLSVAGVLQKKYGDIIAGTLGLHLRVSGERLILLRNGNRIIEKVEFTQAGGGPPVGAPVQLEIKGDDFEILRNIADFAKERLQLIDGVYDIRDNWEEGKEEFHVEIDERRAITAGITVAQIAASLQTAFEGKVATKIREADQEVDIRVIFPENLRERLDSLNKVKVRNAIGNLVPITELATFRKHPGVSVISHADFRRTIYVKANIDEKRNSSVNVNRQILAEMRDYIRKYPGYTLKAGGEFEDTQESMRDLLKAFGVALLVILAILVLQFGNLRHPRVVMLAIPLGMIGVSVTFFIHKILFLPELVFSFLASMGIIGLAGVVVNDSIVLIDFINKLRKAGMAKREAVISAGVYRLRAVLLTTITTVFGLFPTAYGIGGDDPFLRPMALAMGWGLAFATFITLIVVPVYYSIWEDRGFIFHSVFSGRFRREE